MMNQCYFEKLLAQYGKPIFSADIDVEINNICHKLEMFHIDKDKYVQYKLCNSKKGCILFSEDNKLKKSKIYTKYIVNSIDLNSSYKLDWLTKRIEQSYYKECQDIKTFKRKCRIIRYIEKMLKLFDSKSFLFLTGSTITNLGDNLSDVDLCWVIPGYGINNLNLPSNIDKGIIYNKLNETKFFILELLCSYNVINDIYVISSKVPLLKIKFNKKWFDIEVDISINNLPGAMNSKLLHYYSRYDLRFSQLVFYFKNFCKESGYKDAYNNYFNSYSISLMVLHFLQAVVEPPILPNLQEMRPDIFSDYKLLWFPYYQEIYLPPLKINKTPLSELYIKFLKYFGNFQSKYYGISIEKGCLLPRELFIKNEKKHPLFIEEPFEKENTARSLKKDRWIHIRKNLLCEATWLITKSQSL
ncbi:Poly(A) RNA polymerase GLD2 [Strongyloides ratti]|uniref:Poly(A) RNA polymerase GLD2 n=1 Tax=Strongyloides ratti TaxID=34506 RepID=A0A090LD31_STRRB|nr:Poly(A) RNA polymerase GLD2 [Strongyloides ratti]CEF67676.1 Poly(A) RNA polymerase GLD2 [Strongyloides ratti]